MYEQVDGNKVRTYDGFITIFSGLNDKARIKRFVITAKGTIYDKCYTLEDCRKMFENEYGEDSGFTIYVLFDDWTHGELYKYDSFSEAWYQIGNTAGFA